MRNLTLILCGVALAASVASGVMFFLIGNSKQALLTQLGEAEAHGAALADDLAKSHENSAALTEHLHQLDAELGTTKHALDQANITRERLRSALELAEVQRVNATAVADEARNQLRTVQTELISTRDQLAQSIPPSDAQRYRKIIADLESTVGALENQLESAKSTSPPTLIASRAYHAQVMQVASRNAFVVINYGKSHGAVVNQRFTIKRGLNSLAVVEISDSTDNYSIAQVLPETLSGILRTGDAAIITP
jgi:septal ring factor EnvC (AmiA/AmiB activator)